MESPLVVMIAIFSLLLIASTTYARPDPREYKKLDCHSSDMINGQKKFVREFEPRPNISAYDGDNEDKSFVKDFEPRPNISAYDGDKDFEPRPNISAYGDDKKLNGENAASAKDFEPRPNISIYHD